MCRLFFLLLLQHISMHILVSFIMDGPEMRPPQLHHIKTYSNSHILCTFKLAHTHSTLSRFDTYYAYVWWQYAFLIVSITERLNGCQWPHRFHFIWPVYESEYQDMAIQIKTNVYLSNKIESTAAIWCTLHIIFNEY